MAQTIKNSRGSILILVLVLMLAVVPAAGALLRITLSDLNSALEDYEYVRAVYAADTAAAACRVSLEHGKALATDWPDRDVTITITEESNIFLVTAMAGASIVVRKVPAP